MAYFIEKPSNAVIAEDKGYVRHLLTEGTLTHFLPRRLLAKGTGVHQGQVASAVLEPNALCGYEAAKSKYQPANISTAYGVDQYAPAHFGFDFGVFELARYCSVTWGDRLANWLNGQLIGPVVGADDGIWLGMPFSLTGTGETDLNVDLPSTMKVIDAMVEVTTVKGSTTLDAGLLSSEGGGDADGFLDGIDIDVAGFINAAPVKTTGSNEVYYSASTYGALLASFRAGADVEFDVGTYNRINHTCDGTAKSVTVTASDEPVAGNLWLKLFHPNFHIVAKAMEVIDSAAAAAAILGKNLYI